MCSHDEEEYLIRDSLSSKFGVSALCECLEPKDYSSMLRCVDANSIVAEEIG